MIEHRSTTEKCMFDGLGGRLNTVMSYGKLVFVGMENVMFYQKFIISYDLLDYIHVIC